MHAVDKSLINQISQYGNAQRSQGGKTKEGEECLVMKHTFLIIVLFTHNQTWN